MHFHIHVGFKVSVDVELKMVFTTVAIWFSVHVGVNTSCSECAYYSCTVWFSVHVGVETTVHVVTIVTLCLSIQDAKTLVDVLNTLGFLQGWYL